MQNNNKLVIFFFHRDICKLADKYNAMVFIDECHGTGFFGPTGRCVSCHRIHDEECPLVASKNSQNTVRGGGFNKSSAAKLCYVDQRKKKSFLNKISYFKMHLQPI